MRMELEKSSINLMLFDDKECDGDDDYGDYNDTDDDDDDDDDDDNHEDDDDYHACHL